MFGGVRTGGADKEGMELLGQGGGYVGVRTEGGL